MATKTLTPYEARLLAQREALVGRIAQLEVQLETAKNDAATRLAELPPGHELAEQSALRPVMEGQAKLDAYREALLT